MRATIGELCAGYGGLGMGVAQVVDAEVAWYSEIDKGALKILDHRFPGVPNIGDMTTVDWATVPRVDVLCAGYPCQPFSHAGKRKGTDDSRHLWLHVREAIRHLRPRLTVLENVSGHRSLGFDRVLGDLAEDGMHVVWTSLRASDVGAPHQRERLFIAVADAREFGRDGWSNILGDGRHASERSEEGRDAGDCGASPARAVTLLPTPAVNDMGAAYTPETWDAWLDRMKAEHDNGNGHGKSLSIEAQRLLPTPKTIDASGIKTSDRAKELYSSKDSMGDIIEQHSWGEYTEAVTRWESLTRPAPAPTMTSKKGTPQLSPAFSEFMMGLPAGWVTDVPGITRNEALRALGNGVVPQQAAAAVTQLLAHLDGEPTHDRERQEA